MSIIQIEHLIKRFAGVIALDDVSFAVDEGSIHAVIGPNGSGKTTLFNIISGVYRATAGSVVFDGEPIQGLRPFQIVRRGLSRTFQHPRLFGSMTVIEQLIVALHPSKLWEFDKQSEQIAREKLNLVGLEHVADIPAASLPQGQRRLLEIARALCLEPRVLLLDEPHAGLNPVETEQLMVLIRKINQQGITILLVEHEMRVVMTLANKITVLNFGRLLAVGSPQEIQNNPEVITAYLGVREGRLTTHA
ncbi:ABC transporter ATP-binding protein [Alicyclobacillus dauci]|uniref:ABC transporter ATP-binding protein n=1 Tax=Alicyclobacillus dauci TaxID=1475485 RepID=A0ABY6YZ85_9BACL|nr:ABC transporter ATP-binding protein [Alicyclobacillus dauci]WAH35767.1 ABC transporter ATP-binding protein [Alicyclobacillus dauci]